MGDDEQVKGPITQAGEEMVDAMRGPKRPPWEDLPPPKKKIHKVEITRRDSGQEVLKGLLVGHSSLHLEVEVEETTAQNETVKITELFPADFSTYRVRIYETEA